MKIVRRTLIVAGGVVAAFGMLLVTDLASNHGKAVMAQTSQPIAHEVVNRRESGSKKLSLIVEVPLVDGRPPYESELKDLSNHLFASEARFPRKHVTYYLPGMTHGEGAFATGQHQPEPSRPDNPVLKIFLRPYTLLKYPEYERFAF